MGSTGKSRAICFAVSAFCRWARVRLNMVLLRLCDALVLVASRPVQALQSAEKPLRESRHTSRASTALRQD